MNLPHGQSWPHIFFNFHSFAIKMFLFQIFENLLRREKTKIVLLLQPHVNAEKLHPARFTFLICHSRPLLRLFLSLLTNITIFTTNLCEKMSIQYIVPGFKPTTVGT